MSYPTEEEIDKASEYALSKLCTQIPNTIGRSNGLTRWNNYNKTCQITKKGCQPGPKNPISQIPYTSNGEDMDFSEKNRNFGEFWKNFTPGFYVMKTTKKSPKKEICARGNFLLYRWCMFPNTRADGKFKKGLTNVPRFEYTIRNGKEMCEIPKSYCDAKGVQYDHNKKDCYVKDSQKTAEFFSGSVFVRQQNIKKNQSDIKLKKNIKLYKENFPFEGVNVYIFDWNEEALAIYGYTGTDIGFIANELNPKYVYVDDYGYLCIKEAEEFNVKLNSLNVFLKIKNSLLLNNEINKY